MVACGRPKQNQSKACLLALHHPCRGCRMTFHRRFFLLASLASALLVPPATAQTPSGDKLEKVAILLDWRALPTFAGFFLARATGAFERRGLEVTFGETQGALSSA